MKNETLCLKKLRDKLLQIDTKKAGKQAQLRFPQTQVDPQSAKYKQDFCFNRPMATLAMITFIFLPLSTVRVRTFFL